jgi:MoaA/NifB/PqqE/SkfB family radical SAM enzyme
MNPGGHGPVRAMQKRAPLPVPWYAVARWWRYPSAAGAIARNVLAGSPTYPLYASLKLTHRCERSCPFCDVPRRPPVADAALATVRRCIDALSSSSIFVLCLEGGEPFLHGDIEEIVAYAARRRPYVSVVTAYPERCEFLRAYVARHVDFLQLSIDEGHANLDLLQRLPEIRRGWRERVGVQTVVTARDLESLEEKVERVRAAGCKIVVMPAVDLDGSHLAPPKPVFLDLVRRLQRRYPRTLVTAPGYLRGYERGGPCSTASLIIDPDGSVFYPCRMLGRKPFNLQDGDLDTFLRSKRAAVLRREAAACTRGCGWYQYFAVSLRSARAVPGDVRAALARVL